MKIAIIGSGAMGSLFGGRLSLAGNDVVLYDVFREHVEAVNRDGLAIEQAGTGELTVCRPRASTDPESVRGSDVMIVFVKSTFGAALPHPSYWRLKQSSSGLRAPYLMETLLYFFGFSRRA